VPVEITDPVLLKQIADNLYDNKNYGVLLLDKNHEVYHLNNKLSEVSEFSIYEVKGKEISKLLLYDDVDAFIAGCNSLVANADIKQHTLHSKIITKTKSDLVPTEIVMVNIKRNKDTIFFLCIFDFEKRKTKVVEQTPVTKKNEKYIKNLLDQKVAIGAGGAVLLLWLIEKAPHLVPIILTKLF
jgi:transcriptional regulator with PAS, ATPase and Fis domain